MEFFDSLINEVETSLIGTPETKYAFTSMNIWKDEGYSQVILQRDTAYELSGTGFNLVTNKNFDDEIIVNGPELCEIKNDCKFVRVTIVQIENQPDEQKVYNLIRKIEYVKYHYFPDGYMIRTTSRSHKEAVRVSKKAIKNGISFEKIGNLLINKYKEINGVRSVKVIFITDKDAPFATLEKAAEKNSDITETLNHIMNNIKFDCDTCNLKAVCDEVEGIKELHFKNASMG